MNVSNLYLSALVSELLFLKKVSYVICIVYFYIIYLASKFVQVFQ